ncbi:MAG: hypothetical protein V4597_19345 [Pseudomonadota bacterium]
MNPAGPGGYVVVLFGDPAEAWCTLCRCPLGTAQWFPTQTKAAEYAGSVPAGFVPHILLVAADPAQDHPASPHPSTPALGESGAGVPA